MPKSARLVANQINKEEFKQIIRCCLNTAGIELPTDFDADADDLLPDTVDSFNELRKHVCEVIRAKLCTDDTFREKYFGIYKSIAEVVRIEVLRRLDIERYANRLLSAAGLSPRQILHVFLSGLTNGEHWNTATLKKWKTVQGINAGKILCDSLFNNFGVVSESIFRLLIGENSDSLLLRNPLVITPQNVKTEYDAAYYLVEFLKSRSRGPWQCADLLYWTAADGTKGHCLKRWVLKNRGAWSVQVVTDLVGARGRMLLSEKPFSKKGYY